MQNNKDDPSDRQLLRISNLNGAAPQIKIFQIIAEITCKVNPILPSGAVASQPPLTARKSL